MHRVVSIFTSTSKPRSKEDKRHDIRSEERYEPDTKPLPSTIRSQYCITLRFFRFDYFIREHKPLDSNFSYKSTQKLFPEAPPFVDRSKRGLSADSWTALCISFT
ncbi:hypothetical protein CHUAL_009207 [Chamberlinius hualienensis]